jgi:hypothetical protein
MYTYEDSIRKPTKGFEKVRGGEWKYNDEHRYKNPQ